MPMPNYVDNGGQTRAQVTAGAVSDSGIAVASPTTIVVGNLLVVVGCWRVSSNTLDDTLVVTQAGVAWTKRADVVVTAGGAGASGGRHIIWTKPATGGETGVRVKALTVGTPGNGAFTSHMHQFANVRAVVTLGSESHSVTTEGALPDYNVTTVGTDNLAVNFVFGNGAFVGASVGPTGETGGKWELKYYNPTAAANSPYTLVWTASMPVAGAIGGGGASSGSAAGSARGVIGMYFTPCLGAVVSRLPQMMHHYVMQIGAR